MKLYWSLRMKTLRCGCGSSYTSTSSDFETHRAKSPKSDSPPHRQQLQRVERKGNMSMLMAAASELRATVRCAAK